MAEKTYHYALGRRKSATARVRLQSGKGTITVNDQPANEYFADSKYLLSKLQEPFVAIDSVNKFDVSAKVSGGGHDGQIEAVRLGIAKCLALLNPCLLYTSDAADE